MWVLTNSAKLIEKIQSIKSVVTWSTAPSNPSTWDLWYDTTATVNALKMYDWTNWIVMWPELVSLTQAQYDALPAAEKNNGKYYLITDGNWVVVAGWITTTQPSSPTTWDVYYDTTNNVIKVYDGTTWISIWWSPDMSNYLAKDNTTAYTPSWNYNPATKKYVDDLVGDVETLLAAI